MIGEVLLMRISEIKIKTKKKINQNKSKLFMNYNIRHLTS